MWETSQHRATRSFLVVEQLNHIHVHEQLYRCVNVSIAADGILPTRVIDCVPKDGRTFAALSVAAVTIAAFPAIYASLKKTFSSKPL